MGIPALVDTPPPQEFDRDVWVRETMERLADVVNDAADAYAGARIDPPAAEEVAHRVMDLVLPMPDDNPMVALLAPFWSSRKLQDELGASRQALDSRMKAGTLLGLKTGDGQLAFPVFQFIREPSGGIRVRPGVSAMLKAVRASPDFRPWTFATLLRTPASELDDLTPYEWMRAADRDQAALQPLARRWVREWSH